MGKRGVLIGFTTMGQMMSVMMKKAFSKLPITLFTAKANNEDLTILSNLIKEGKIKPHLGKTYSYSKLPDAIGHVESKSTQGKVVMSWEM